MDDHGTLFLGSNNISRYTHLPELLSITHKRVLQEDRCRKTRHHYFENRNKRYYENGNQWDNAWLSIVGVHIHLHIFLQLGWQ